MAKCDFNKVAKQINFIEITIRHGCSPVKLLYIFRTLFPKIPSRQLLLLFHYYKSAHRIFIDRETV